MTESPRPEVHSLYWANVDPRLLAAQRAVFEHLGIPLQQHLRDRMPHGVWMDEILAQEPEGIVVFCDIDAVPLRAGPFDRLVARARAGRIAGLAQSCNHLGNPRHIYAAPMFLALDRGIWRRLGSPSMAADSEHDAGQRLCIAAEARGVPVETVLPSSCLITIWPLADKRLYGIGTFYGENDFFHLYQSRKRRFLQAFLQVCEDVCADRPPDMARYLLTVRPKSRLPKPLRKYFVIS
ncbi:hypothetical protein [Frigidibacter sp. ROC022]|uniref:hypothetical protein n=1 Tax=Frigidibacter sp. ROC022 TaxID=2971796 RepID=UPI00215A828A|nr:hypothetical protein [Frigidibacter sp. ROC022]MCR8726831.1 hypothetical protein [Frigidibacter sp. ROC022]